MKEWLLARWRWLALGAALVAAFVWGFFTRKPQIVTPSLYAQKARAKVEEQAELRKARLRKELEIQLAAIRNKQDVAVQELTDEQISQYASLKSNPQELNKWLLSVGKSAR